MGGLDLSRAESEFRAVMERSMQERGRSTARGGGGNSLVALPIAPTETDAAHCTICLDDDRETPWTRFPCCKNYGHLACSQRWLQSNAKCAICRATIP
jgi:hypothetical protein